LLGGGWWGSVAPPPRGLCTRDLRTRLVFPPDILACRAGAALGEVGGAMLFSSDFSFVSSSPCGRLGFAVALVYGIGSRLARP